jgi:paraquat-inducible protein B
MAKQANKTVIGLFVVGAIVLLVAALVIFGGGKFFVRANQHVAFFEGSVKGLSIGAPVMFRGVRIGKVDNFKVYFKFKEEQFKIPVLITLYPDKVIGIGLEEEFAKYEKDTESLWKQVLERGLRAQ